MLAAEAHDDERMQLGRDAGDRGLESEYAETIAAAAEQAAASAADEFEQLTPGFRIELPMFLAMVARKLGTDTMFVLAYSVIMLNTDAHNPQLKGNERISKAQFIENNKRSPDLAAISEVIMASLYDEIVHKEIKLKDEDESDTGDDSAAEVSRPHLILIIRTLSSPNPHLIFSGSDRRAEPGWGAHAADVDRCRLRRGG